MFEKSMMQNLFSHMKLAYDSRVSSQLVYVGRTQILTDAQGSFPVYIVIHIIWLHSLTINTNLSIIYTGYGACVTATVCHPQANTYGG